MEEKEYSVKDLCDIFNINPNTFPSIARRLGLNTEEYCRIEINEFKTPKRLYNEIAYKRIEEYSLEKQKKNVVKEKEISKYLQKIEDKEKIIEDLHRQLDFTQKLLITEKGEKQQLQQQLSLLAEDNKKISELENENRTLMNTNGSYIKQNHELEGEKYKLELQNEEYAKQIQTLNEEMNKIKNRGFFARLFNK
ncbi:MAG: hypothetical protein J6O41_05270 [Clostridia bacterium]|nr:hypothetical protein [Clostridia bacterium]